MEVENLKNIYDDTVGWLKFVELKITALITFETGLIYFIYKEMGKQLHNKVIIVGFCFLIVAVLILLLSLIPSKGKVGNPLYFLSWTDKQFIREIKLNEGLSKENYVTQIAAVADVTLKKINLIRLSMIVYVVGIIIIFWFSF